MLPSVAVGDTLAERYRVERILGQGGMGVVVSATDEQLRRRVAIKLLHADVAERHDAGRRFLREARAAARIQSEHVARVIDMGQLPDGNPYLVMEHLDGVDLAQRLKQGIPAIEETVDWVLQAAEALAEAHAYGIVHRDLKPSNLFLARRRDGGEIVKVLDFGVSKFAENLSGSVAPLTSTTQTVGSPVYMSPEQMRAARNVTAASDLWSVGVIMYELLVGERPFNASNLPDLVVTVTTREPRPLRERRPEIAEGLAAAVMRCLAKAPRDRFPDLGELAQALSPYGSARSQGSADRISGILAAPPSTDFAPREPAPPYDPHVHTQQTVADTRASEPPPAEERRSGPHGTLIQGLAPAVTRDVPIREAPIEVVVDERRSRTRRASREPTLIVEAPGVRDAPLPISVPESSEVPPVAASNTRADLPDSGALPARAAWAIALLVVLAVVLALVVRQMISK